MANKVGVAATMAGVGAARMAAGSYTIKADTKKMAATANSLKKKIDKLQYEFNTMMDTVNESRNYWEGVAADSYRSEFKEESPEFDEAFRRMREHVADLHTIASEYNKTEIENEDLAESLLTEVID